MDMALSIRILSRFLRDVMDFREISRLNKEIEDEYLRLAIGQRRHTPKIKENRISKWLGLKYLTGEDTGRLHSSTAFVEFKSLAAKQHAVQCNILGTNQCMEVKPVPEVRDLIWDNMVSYKCRVLVLTKTETRHWLTIVVSRRSMFRENCSRAGRGL